MKNGKDILNLTQRQINKLNNSFDHNKGSALKISKTQIRYIVRLSRKNPLPAKKAKQMMRGKSKALVEYKNQKGASLLSGLVPAVTKFLPKIASTIGLSGIAGAIEGLTKKLIGNGSDPNCQCKETYVIEHDRLPELAQYRNLLTDKQIRNLENALINRRHLAITPTITQQNGGFLGLLAGTLGASLLSTLIPKLLGKGMTFPRVQGRGMNFPIMPYQPTPYLAPYIGCGKKVLESKMEKASFLDQIHPFWEFLSLAAFSSENPHNAIIELQYRPLDSLPKNR